MFALARASVDVPLMPLRFSPGPRLLLLLLLTAAGGLLLLTALDVSAWGVSDKVLHAGAFAWLALLLHASLHGRGGADAPRVARLIVTMAGIAAAAVASEMAQELLGGRWNRRFSAGDIAVPRLGRMGQEMKARQ